MFDRLKALFQSPRPHKAQAGLELAATSLMLEAAGLDGEVDHRELAVIVEMLARHFDLSAEEAKVLIEEAEALVANSVQMLSFTRPLKDGLAPEERVKIIEMLWEVTYADGHAHHNESNLVRRVAGLIYVSDTEAGAARKRVLARLGLNP